MDPTDPFPPSSDFSGPSISGYSIHIYQPPPWLPWVEMALMAAAAAFALALFRSSRERRHLLLLGAICLLAYMHLPAMLFTIAAVRSNSSIAPIVDALMAGNFWLEGTFFVMLTAYVFLTWREAVRGKQP